MIAYSYFIDFVPKLKNEKNTINVLAKSITVKQSPYFDLYKNLWYQLKFFNNQGREMSLYCKKEYSYNAKEQIWAFEIKEVLSFFWENGSSTVSYIAHEKFTEQLLKYWTLHILLPIFLTVTEKYDFLHAGAVEVEHKSVLFVAESFGGKSTMTGFFLKQGHALISDDKVACCESDGVFFAHPSIPYHRPYRKMEDLGYFVENMATIPKPIHAIYELDRAVPQASIVISELHGIEKFKSLCYSSEINLSFLKTKRFAFLAQMAKSVRVYRVTVPWDLERLDEVYKAIVAKSREG